MELQRIVLQMDKKLVAEIEEYAAQLHLNRTAACTVLLTNALKNDKTVNNLDEVVKFIKIEQARAADPQHPQQK